MNQGRCVRLAVVGDIGTGKTSLVARINEQNYCRSLDHSHFQFHARECEQFSAHLWKDFDLVLVTFGLDKGVGTARILANEIADSATHRGLVCLVGTKLDLVPRDYSDLALESHIYSNFFEYFDTLHYFAISCSKDVGLKELLDFITNKIYPTPSSAVYNAPSAPFFVWKRITVWFLDSIAALFSLPVPAYVNQQSPDPHELDDDAVNTLVESPETKAWDAHLKQYSRGIMGGVPAHKITSTLIAKSTYPSEYANMQFVRRHTSIPVPQPRYPHLSSWLVMDYVDGKMLLECWDTLSFFMKFRIACTLRGYISQLRQLRGTVPGTVARGIVSGVLFDDEEYGPFESATRFRQFCEIAAHDGWKSRVKHPFLGQARPSLPAFGGEWSLVFTHADLNLTNIILSNDGVLWIIDWATSGFFPPWLETVGMRYYEDDAPISWRRLRWFIAGTNPRYEYFWDNLMINVHRYSRLPATYPRGHLGLTIAGDNE